MIPTACKRLAEVDFPIAEVSKHAAREKSIRHGHPSTLHLWWARRPLASSRAVLMALLLPDPCDLHCPEEFKVKVREALPGMKSRPSGWEQQVKTDDGLRRALLKFIADFANWDNSATQEFLDAGRALVNAARSACDRPGGAAPRAGRRGSPGQGSPIARRRRAHSVLYDRPARRLRCLCCRRGRTGDWQ